MSKLLPLLLVACTTGGVIRVDPLPAPSDTDCRFTVEGGDDPRATLVPRYLGVFGDVGGALARGTAPTVQFGLENVGGEDDLDYPQLEVYAEAIAHGDLGTTWYGLARGQRQDLAVSPTVPSDFLDDRVVFEASATRLDCQADCPAENLLTVTFCVVD
jgi:hypothetical protein